MYREKFMVWMGSPYVDESIKEELKQIEKFENEIEDRFYKELEFGTGGMRGKIGAGTNRINIITVGKATQGIANYLNEKYKEEDISVAIAYDSRYMSEEFAKRTASVFACNDINVYLFDSLRPTPELSYAVRYFGCKGGVVITASHNPAEYNGYKVYDEHGGQVVKDAEKIIEKIKDVKIEQVKYNCTDDIWEERVKIIGESVDLEYINDIEKLSLRKNVAKNIKIVYTPLHGSGSIIVRKALNKMGYRDVNVVKEQEQPDSNFSTVKSPNPEEISAFELAIKKAEEIDADVIIGTDPDCDRVGVIVKNNNNEYMPLNGNQTGVLLLNYILESMNENSLIPENAAVVKTIVTSDLCLEIANYYGVKTFETLTGFKYIAELIQKFCDNKEYNFIFGYEESYGYLAGTFVRDKDAVITSMLICEMVSYYKSCNKTLVDELNEIHKKFSYYVEETISLNFTGISGQNKMKSIMEKFRENKLNVIAGQNIPYIQDYKLGIISNLVNGTTTRLDFPKSDVLKFCFENGSWIALRPSGTEPKLKIYISVKSDNEESAVEIMAKIKNEITIIIDRTQFNLY